MFDYAEDSTVQIGALAHVAIKARDVQATQRFYIEVLDLTLDRRPEIGFPGIWLKTRHAQSAALLHIYAGDAALEPDGSFASGTGAIDHISIAAQGYPQFQERFRRFGLQWRENIVPESRLWQLFVYDPSAVLLELTFLAAAETVEEIKVMPELRYSPRENFFRVADYDQFSASQPSAFPSVR
jgi:catechol 2,3-dioxygenase-like lactoylglutathione lyase family enzyme